MTCEWRAVLLAGGRSSRMGTDKAALPWGDGTLLTHMRTLLLAAGANDVVVSGNHPQFDGIPDGMPDTGPMGALAQLAPRLQDGTWMVAPVDMPLLSVDLLQALLTTGATCTCVDGHPLPMALRVDAATRTVIEAVGARSGGRRGISTSVSASRMSCGTVALMVRPPRYRPSGARTPKA